jgi:hypothetical protein
MIYLWEIFVEGVSKGYIRAFSENSAIDHYYMKYGSASKYTGLGRNQITAVRV